MKKQFNDCIITYDILNLLTHVSFIIGYLVALIYAGIYGIAASEGADVFSKVFKVCVESLIPFAVFVVFSSLCKMKVVSLYYREKSVDEEDVDRVFAKFRRSFYFRIVDIILIIVLIIFVGSMY